MRNLALTAMHRVLGNAARSSGPGWGSRDHVVRGAAANMDSIAARAVD